MGRALNSQDYCTYNKREHRAPFSFSSPPGHLLGKGQGEHSRKAAL